jgi:hypothetical protein
LKFDEHPIIKIDHLGNEYKSMQAMLDHYGISYVPFMYRLQIMKLSLEEALTRPMNSNLATAIKCKDHLGNVFESKAAMCDHWHIPRTVFFRRQRQGWSLERSLTTPLDARYQHKTQTRFIKDHKGNIYSCIEEMCKAYNISKKQYLINIRNNCSIEEALTTITETDVIKDHKGNVYRSINEMCRTYGITKTTLRSRLELGWTLAEILERPQKLHPEKTVKDHLGNKYNSVNEMLEHYGISHIKYMERLKRGYTLEQALMGDANFAANECCDHLGNVFKKKKDMALYWNTKSASIWSKLKKGKSLEYALTNIAMRHNKNFGPGIAILKQIDKDYYEINLYGQKLVWNTDSIFDYYRKHCLKNEGQDLIIKRVNIKKETPNVRQRRSHI